MNLNVQNFLFSHSQILNKLPLSHTVALFRGWFTTSSLVGVGEEPVYK